MSDVTTHFVSLMQLRMTCDNPPWIDDTWHHNQLEIVATIRGREAKELVTVEGLLFRNIQSV